MRKFLLLTTAAAAAGLIVGVGPVRAESYVTASPNLVWSDGAGTTSESGKIPTTTADPRVSEEMVDQDLPLANGQQQWSEHDVVGDTAPHPLFTELAERRPEPQQAAMPEPRPDPQSLTEKIFFEFDKATLTPEGEAKIDRLTEVMRGWNLRDVEVVGHADRSGPPGYNDALSQRRAETVAAAFTARGLNPTIVNTEWYGESRPAVETPDGQELQANRRAEVQAVE